MLVFYISDSTHKFVPTAEYAFKSAIIINSHRRWKEDGRRQEKPVSLEKRLALRGPAAVNNV